MTTKSEATTTKKPAPKRRTRKAAPKLSPWEKSISKLLVMGLAFVIMTMLGVSLEHLAHGIQTVTGSPAWSSWSLAVAVDVGMVSSEVALIVLSRLPDIGVEKYAKRFVLATIAISMALNILAFWPNEMGSVSVCLAVVLGMGIPAGIYHLTRVAGNIWLTANIKK